MFTPHYVDVMRQGSTLTELLTLEPDCGADVEPDLWRVETRQVHVYKYYHKVYDAYAAARSARFEHGQSGRVIKGGFRR